MLVLAIRPTDTEAEILFAEVGFSQWWT